MLKAASSKYSFYEGKVVLAPMVRVGTLPMRLLALDYGADLVWTPETVDKKLIGCDRIFNPTTGTWDYIKDGRTLVFRTHPREKPHLIMQLGSADPELALKAALLVESDVSGVDLNCGCPKRFSLQAGMGAALLSQPEKLCSILRSLVAGLRVPVTAKIRVLPQREDTLSLVRQICQTGIQALTVHCRTPAERPRDPAHYELLDEIISICHPMPVIVNGDVFDREDLHRIRQQHPLVASVMIARGAQWNASIFQAGGMDPDVRQVSRLYLAKCVETANPFTNTKYTVMQMWIDRPYSDHRFTEKIQKSKNITELCAVFDMSIDEGRPGESTALLDGQDDD